MANSRQNKEESVGSQRVDHFVSLEQRRDREHNQSPSIRVETQHTEHTDRTQLRTGSHVSHKALTQGYWWPSMQRVAQDYVKKCDQCQRYAPNIHQPRGVLNPLSSPWPFA